MTEFSRIKQGYISESVGDFSFIETCRLRPYDNENEPAIFFGCYTDQDVQAILNHKAKAVVHWMGQDAIECVFYGRYLELHKVHHIGFHHNIIKVLSPFLDIRSIPAWTTKGEFKPTEYGDSIYCYAPANHPYYHNRHIIDSVIEQLPECKFIVSLGDVPQHEWIPTKANEVYDSCFLGLVLNNFAGGANTIMQLTMKGRKVITNALHIPPATQRWSDSFQIVDLIREIANQNLNPKEISESVSIDTKHNFLNLSNYE